MSDNDEFVLTASAIESMDEEEFLHPLNPRSGAHYRSLSDATGMSQVGIHQIRLGPGREANELHTHRFEDEFYFVLRGRGVMLIDDREHEIGPGAFVGLPAPSPPHLMTNPFDEDLVYLVGGQRSDFEVAEFPRHDKVLFRAGHEAWVADAAALERPVFEVEADDDGTEPHDHD